MTDDRPQLGPWLRHYARQQESTPRERLPEYLVAGAVAVGALVLIVGVLLAFLRSPFVTLGLLALVWVIGYVVFLTKRQRADARERALRESVDRDDRRR